jgi:ribonuclease J
VKKQDELVFVPLGGVGEIGMNLALYGYGQGKTRQWLAVDMGVAFGKDDLPGVDAVLPDIGFLLSQKNNLAGIAITHAHEDHFGALFDFWPQLEAPVFMTPFAAGLLAAKKAGEPGAPDIPVSVTEQGSRVTAGPFEVEYVPVSHSIPECNSLAIRTPAGLVVHTADWKLDPTPLLGKPTDEARFAALGEEGVLALICDSTNAIRDGVSPSEADVAGVMEAMIAEAPHRVVVTTFASNVSRLRTVAIAAQKAGREVVVVGRSIHRALAVAAELGYLDGLPPFHDQNAFGQFPRNKVVALMTGSQGEQRAALARVAGGGHPAVKLAPGDRIVFSSRTIPGNERSINGIINALVDQGMEIVTDRDALVHVSGHPRRDELRQMYEWTRPQILVPVHGEALHLHEQAKLGREADVPEVIETRNGGMLRLVPGPAEKLKDVTSGRLFRDGKLLLDPDTAGIADRRRMSWSGAVFVSVVMTAGGVVEEDPQIALIGLPLTDNDGETFQTIVEDAVDEALDNLPKKRRMDADAVRDIVRRAVRSEVDAVWGKKPPTVVLVTYLEG